MSPHRRYQSSSLNFGIGLNGPSSPQIPITPAEIAVSPVLTYRKIPLMTSPDFPKSEHNLLPATSPPPPQWGRPSTVAPSVSAISNLKGDKTYRVRHHHQNHYEPSPSPSSLSQGIFGLPVLQDYLRSSSPPASQYRRRQTEDREWEYEELGGTKLLDSTAATEPQPYHYQKEAPPKLRMKTTLAPGRPGTPPYLIPDEMDGIIQVRPASRSRTRPEQHSYGHPSAATGGQRKGARRRVKSTSGAVHSAGNGQQQQPHHHPGTRVSTAMSTTSQEQTIMDADPSSVDSHLQECLAKLKSSDWEEICKAFKKIQVATLEAPSQVRSVLKRIIWLALPHFSSARTKISRSACQCFKKLYETQRRSMEGEGDKVFQKLLDLCGSQSNKFIQEEGKAALFAAVQNMDGNKCLQLIEQNGVKHKNGNVREFAALLLGKIIDRLHVDKVMTNREYAMKVVPMIVGFLREGQLNTRLNAKDCLGKIFDHPQFHSVLHRYVTPENIRHVTDTLTKFRGASRKS